MEAKRHQEMALDRQRWEVVKQWPELREGAKLAWLYLWGQANGRAQSMHVHPGSVGADQGANDSRTGANYLKRLAERGLIEIIDRKNYPWSIYVNDPLEVKKQMFKKISADPQGELYPDETPADDLPDLTEEEPTLPMLPKAPEHDRSTAESAQTCARDPASPMSLDVFKEDAQPPISSLNVSDVITLEKQDRAHDHAHKFARDEAPPKSLPKTPGPKLTRPEGDLGPEPTRADFGAAMDRFTGAVMRSFEAKETEAHRQADRIFKAVGSSTLYRSVCLKIAWAVVDGNLPAYKLSTVLESLAKFKVEGVNRDGTQQTPENWRKYFVESMIRCFGECGLSWQGKPRKKEPDDAEDDP